GQHLDHHAGRGRGQPGQAEQQRGHDQPGTPVTARCVAASGRRRAGAARVCRLDGHTRMLRPGWQRINLAELSPEADQYSGRDGSTWLIQASTPPPTCTASAKPAFLTTARTSALRTPLLQCSTIFLSCGMCSSAAPVRNWSLGISVAPGIETISYSFGSRTSTR